MRLTCRITKRSCRILGTSSVRASPAPSASAAGRSVTAHPGAGTSCRRRTPAEVLAVRGEQSSRRDTSQAMPRPASARHDDWKMPAVRDTAALEAQRRPSGMQRRSNAAGLSPRAAMRGRLLVVQGANIGSIRDARQAGTAPSPSPTSVSALTAPISTNGSVFWSSNNRDCATRPSPINQPIRLLDRQWPQEELLEEGEDRRVGPDAEGQRGDRDDGDERRAEERAQRAPQRECVHGGGRSY